MLSKSIVIAVLSLASVDAFAQGQPAPAKPFWLEPTSGREVAVQRWVHYQSDEGGYRIEMPTMPAVRRDPVELSDGRRTSALFANSRKGDVEFVVRVTDYPAGYLDSNPEHVLDEMRDLQSANKTLVRETRLVSSTGQPGREYVIADNGTYFAVRTLLIGNRLYLLVTAGGRNANMDKDPDVRRFLDSFQFAVN